VYCGPTIWPNNDQELEDLARYIIRACFSQERMTYIAARDPLDGQAKVIYRSKDKVRVIFKVVYLIILFACQDAFRNAARSLCIPLPCRET
jgi:hypothetical protein